VADLRTQLGEDLKDAMRARDVVKRETVRYLMAGLKNAEIAAMHPLSEDEAQAVLVSQIKQRRDSIDQFGAAGRADLVAKEEAELAVLSSYLPPPPTGAEVESAIRDAIAASGASSLKDMAPVVRIVLDRFAGRVDGKVVASRVRGALSG
jgi:uncharacterized protein